MYHPTLGSRVIKKKKKGRTVRAPCCGESRPKETETVSFRYRISYERLCFASIQNHANPGRHPRFGSGDIKGLVPQSASRRLTRGTRYRGTSLLRKCALQGSSSRAMPRALRWSCGSVFFLCARYPCTPRPPEPLSRGRYQASAAHARRPRPGLGHGFRLKIR